jgi:hypothetical protein
MHPVTARELDGGARYPQFDCARNVEDKGVLILSDSSVS